MTLKQAREARGVSQDYIAKRVNVTQSAVSRWEKGEPCLAKYHKLVAKVLGVKAEDIDEFRRE